MPEIAPGDPTLKTLKGRHLWHAPMSSCSQRVRICLAEAGAEYESHIVNLERDEHATPEYQAIHPKGLVPAYVEDGRLIIESTDIIQEIGGDALAASDPHGLLALADASQNDLKLLTFEFLFRVNPPPPEEAVAAFQSNHQNAWLKAFRRDFAEGFARARLNSAIARTDAGFWTLEEVLADGRDYLGGAAFSTLDIAWMPNLHRFALMGWPFHRYPSLANWFARIKTRRSYRDALLAFQPEGVGAKFADYTDQRRRDGTDVMSFDPFRDPRKAQK